MKHRLELESLSIESFATVEVPGARGTVYAHVATDPTCYETGCHTENGGFAFDPLAESADTCDTADTTTDDFASLHRTCTWSMKSLCN